FRSNISKKINMNSRISNEDFWGLEPDSTFFKNPKHDPFSDFKNEFPKMDRKVKVVKRQVNTSSSKSSDDDDNLPVKHEVVTENGEKKFRLHINVGTYTHDNIDISLKGRTLTIKCKQEEKSEDGYSGAFRAAARQFTYPFNVDLTGLTSTMSNGILKIDAPMSKQ
ncbi:unnamed protein product, partial [Allacma fusca]